MLVDGESTGPERVEVEKHIAVCERCKRTYERLTTLDERLRRLPATPPRTDLAAAVKTQVFGEKTGAWEGTPLALWRNVPALIMILLLAVGLGNMAGRSMVELLQSRGAETVMEIIGPEPDGSLADAVLDIHFEETSR
jgi:anti-sigma factor RsiW